MPDTDDPRALGGFGVGSGAAGAEGERQRRRMLTLLRALFLFLLVVFTALVIVQDSATRDGFELVRWWPLAVGGMLLLFGGFVALDELTPKRKLSTVSAVFVGLIAGVLVTAIIGTVLDLFSEIYGVQEPRLLAPFKVMLGLGICYLTVSTVLQTQDDFRLVIPYVEFSRKIRGARPILLDSSALIDGRVLEVAELGFFQAPLVAPRAVIEELQRMSDSADRLKRARGRRGLEMLARLQRVGRADVSVEEAEAPGTTVDQKVIELARALPGIILTTDVGLARVAAIEGIVTLNLNDLANALKQNATPGDEMQVSLVRRGEQPGQAVAFLPDGTMIVVDDAADLIGTQAQVTVTSALQTSAGRMIFARPVGRERARSEGRPARRDDENGPGQPEEPARGEAEASAAPENGDASVEVAHEEGAAPTVAAPPGAPPPPPPSGPGPVRPVGHPKFNRRNPRRG